MLNRYGGEQKTINGEKTDNQDTKNYTEVLILPRPRKKGGRKYTPPRRRKKRK
jgi:hypothetical protein